jgi:pimeloyl-ACP methyl ester carboxylesterase
MTAVAADTPPTMTAPPLRVLDHPLARVTYADTGQGRPALVWLHGALCSHADWAGSLAHFAPRHRCIAPDLPGHGASPAGPAAIGVRAYALVVRELCAALALDDVVLVAHSMSCRVALQAAVGLDGEGPACAGPLPGLRGLVLVDGAYLTLRLLGDADAAERQALAAQARARAAALYETATPMARAARGFGQMFFDPAFDAVRDRMIERARALPPEVARALMPDFAAWDVEHMEQVLPRLRVPVLAFVCTYMNSAHERVRLAADTRTPWIEALQQHVRALELERVPGAGHFPMLEQQQAVHGRIEAWLQGLPAPCPWPPGGDADAAGAVRDCHSATDSPAVPQPSRSVADTPVVPQGPSAALATPPAPHP